MTDDITHYDTIEAYCNELSYSPGSVAELCVHIDAARLAARSAAGLAAGVAGRFDVVVERWGGARERVWSADDIAGTTHTTPEDADAFGCGWSVSVEIPIDTSWRSGFYLVTLTAHNEKTDNTDNNNTDNNNSTHDNSTHGNRTDGRDKGYACFVVTTAPDHRAPNPDTADQDTTKRHSASQQSPTPDTADQDTTKRHSASQQSATPDTADQDTTKRHSASQQSASPVARRAQSSAGPNSAGPNSAGPDSESNSSTLLFVLATNTWNAYNSWGGRSLYSGGTQVAFRRPWGRGMLMRPTVERDDRKSRPRYTDEVPDVDGEIYQSYRFANGYPGFMGSAGWFTHERRFVEWAERSGHRFDYAVSSDVARLHATGELARYRAIVSVGHDEYWSADQRDAVEAFVANGGNVASLSGNTMFWQVRPAPVERGGSTMICHKYTAHITDPLVASTPSTMTGMWADPVVGRPESNFLAAASLYGLYHRFGQATAHGVGGFVIHRDDHWMLANTGLRYGDVLGADHGVVGYETVGCLLGFDDARLPVAVADPELAGSILPGETCVVAYTQSSNLGVGEYPKSISAVDDQGDLEFIAERVFGGGPAALAKVRHGNSVMLTCRPAGSSGGEVVVVGSTDWVFGLADPAVAQVTNNILSHITAPQPRSAQQLAHPGAASC